MTSTGTVVAILVSLLLAGGATAENFRVLVFSKSNRSPHASRADGIALVKSLASTHGFKADFSQDSADFTDENLARYAAVVFMNTGGDVLNPTQQAAFRRYIGSGGGFVGVHAAAVTETSWVWFKSLVGATFSDHPAQQFATIRVDTREHPSTAHLPDTWTRWDEWYNYRSNPRSNVTVLLTLDESSYRGGTMGADHPIAWYHEFDGGRSWYTGLGHTPASYREPAFRQHLLGGILYAAGADPNELMRRCETLVPSGSEWSYWDRGQDLGTAWSAPEFDDRHWPSGMANLGAGNGNHHTIVNPGPASAPHRTTYFRHRFQAADAPLVSRLTLRLLRDDGAIVYLNGTEIARSNMAEGAVTYHSFASRTVETAEEEVFFDLDLTASAEALRSGDNVIAVELHQAEGGDSDLGFDLALEREAVIPPRLEIKRAAGGDFEVSWRQEYTTAYDAVLEGSATLTDWAPVSGEPAFRNGVATLTVPGAGRRFFRLRYRLPTP